MSAVTAKLNKADEELTNIADESDVDLGEAFDNSIEAARASINAARVIATEKEVTA